MAYERQLNFYIDANVPEWYVETPNGAALLAAQVKSISYGELVRASVQLTDGAPKFDANGAVSNAWTAFAGSGATAELVVDNNFNWWDDCKLHSALESGVAVSSIEISGLNAVPRALGSIRLSSSDIVHYNAYSVSGGTYTFNLADASFDDAAFTPSASYAANSPVRLVEMPVIVSSNDAATPATGLFAGSLDAGNPVYENLIEGSQSISGTQLEFTIYVDGRAVFRTRCLFDCLSAISPGEDLAWLRPNQYAALDSRYYSKSAGVSLEGRVTALETAVGSFETQAEAIIGEGGNA